jgi:hypothetical protein
MIFFKAPSALSRAISRIVSMASLFAASMKPQVLMTTASARPGRAPDHSPRPREGKHLLAVHQIFRTAQRDQGDSYSFISVGILILGKIAFDGVADLVPAEARRAR